MTDATKQTPPAELDRDNAVTKLPTPPRHSSAETAELHKALALAQSRIKAPNKRHTATVKTKTGGEYSYSYADLSDIIACLQPAFGEGGLSHSSQTVMAGDRLILRTMLRHASGQWIASEYPLPSGLGPQEMGAQLTYHRRYQLCCLTGVAAEEDTDGGVEHAAAGKKAPPKERKEAPPKDTSPSLKDQAQELVDKIAAATTADGVQQLVSRSEEMLAKVHKANPAWHSRILAIAEERTQKLMEVAGQP